MYAFPYTSRATYRQRYRVPYALPTYSLINTGATVVYRPAIIGRMRAIWGGRTSGG